MYSSVDCGKKLEWLRQNNGQKKGRREERLSYILVYFLWYHKASEMNEYF